MGESSSQKILFVMDDDVMNDNRENQICYEAYEESYVNGRKPISIIESDFKKVDLKENTVLVFPKFEGNAFQIASNSPCRNRVYGPLCILHCLRKDVPFPDGPVFSYTMENLNICFSGFGTQKEEELRRKVLYMGGKCSDDLQGEATHLVVAENIATNSPVLSTIYHIAAKLKKSIMQERWIHESLKLSHNQLIYAKEPPLCDMKCPLFSNLKISCSRIPQYRSITIQQVVESRGGEYVSKLVKDGTDILIVGCYCEIENENLKWALKWKIPCVSEDWFEKSVESGYSLEHTDFIQVQYSFFIDLKFAAGDGLTKDEKDRMKAMVLRSGGNWYKKTAIDAIDYIILPVLDTEDTEDYLSAKEKVTPFWIEECFEKRSIVPIQYYHLLMEIPAYRGKPLSGYSFAVSEYSDKETAYLYLMSERLGASIEYEEDFVEKNAPGASTHLICRTPSGDAYEAAIRWKLPVVTKDWLLACASSGIVYSEKPYLLEGSSMPQI